MKIEYFDIIDAFAEHCELKGWKLKVFPHGPNMLLHIYAKKRHYEVFIVAETQEVTYCARVNNHNSPHYSSYDYDHNEYGQEIAKQLTHQRFPFLISTPQGLFVSKE